MAIVDDRGRLFGKINLIDLTLIVLAVLAIPLGYGAYLLFRTPVPRITSFEPSTVVITPAAPMRIAIKGQNLRPFLKASLDTQPVRSFLVESPLSGEIVLTEPEP